MSWILAVDSSTACAYVALKDLAGTAVIEAQTDEPNSHIENLATLISAVLEQAGCDWGDVSALGVGAGPGSFTGLRIGYSLLKGLALARAIPLLAVSSFEAFVWPERGRARLLAAMADARRDELFFALYRSASNAGLQRVSGPLVLSRSGCMELLEAEAARVGLTQEEISVVAEGVLPQSCAYRWLKPVSLARSIAEILSLQKKQGAADSEVIPLGVDSLAELRPEYVREAAARTIAERSIR